jgi:hypothetical protein
MEYLIGRVLARGCLAYLIGCATVQASAPTTSGLRETARTDDLHYFVGSWSAQAEDPGTGRTFTFLYRIEPTLDGTWLTGYAESPEQGVKVRDFWGRDASTGEIVRIIIDSQGTYGIARAKSWEGDTLRFEGEARSKEGTILVRETITRLDSSEFKAVWEAKLEKGWSVYSIERLKRDPAH